MILNCFKCGYQMKERGMKERVKGSLNEYFISFRNFVIKKNPHKQKLV